VEITRYNTIKYDTELLNSALSITPPLLIMISAPFDGAAATGRSNERIMLMNARWDSVDCCGDNRQIPLGRKRES
jgi:hypothetical protein